MEFSLGYRLEWREFVNAGIVDQHVEAAERRLGLCEQPLDVGRFRDVAMKRDRLAALGGNFGYDLVSSALARSVVHHYGGAFGGELPGDACADAFRGAGHYRYFTR